jgi:thioester reductase-like protein
VLILEHTYFITGFPGFIATKLLEALQNKYPSSQFYLLTLKQERKIAEQKLKDYGKNTVLLEGDITKEGLGLPDYLSREIAEKITHCIHLAALYDLTAAYSPSYSCNVIGTEHVIKFVKTCKNIRQVWLFQHCKCIRE